MASGTTMTRAWIGTTRSAQTATRVAFSPSRLAISAGVRAVLSAGTARNRRRDQPMPQAGDQGSGGSLRMAHRQPVQRGPQAGERQERRDRVPRQIAAGNHVADDPGQQGGLTGPYSGASTATMPIRRRAKLVSTGGSNGCPRGTAAIIGLLLGYGADVFVAAAGICRNRTNCP